MKLFSVLDVHAAVCMRLHESERGATLQMQQAIRRAVLQQRLHVGSLYEEWRNGIAEAEPPVRTLG